MKITIDAKNKTVGRIATDIALKLQGKETPAYNPRLPGTNEIEVVNAAKMRFTGNKLLQKKHHWHTGYMGGIKERTLKQAMEKNPSEVIRLAVLRMLPKNRLRQVRMNRLHISN